MPDDRDNAPASVPPPPAWLVALIERIAEDVIRDILSSHGLVSTPAAGFASREPPPRG